MEIKPNVPNEPRPKLTIQDSYLKYYFIGFSQNKAVVPTIKVDNTNTFLHKKKIREDENNKEISNNSIENKNISCTIVKSAEIYTNKPVIENDNKEDDLVPLVIRNKNKK